MRPLLFCILLAASFSAPAADELVKVISHGAKIDVSAQLIPGKYTAIEFYADW